VIARHQLLALGFTRNGISHRRKTGRLHLLTRGVYSVGRTGLSQEGRWMAALLACGAGAVLSHRSAGAHYGIADERPGAIEVSIRGSSEPRRDGLRVRSRPSLPSREVGTLRGIPITSPVRTMLDLARVLGPRGLERAVNEADKRDVVDAEALRDALDDHVGEPGVRPLRRLLDRDTFVLSDEELEVLFRPLALKAGLPLPETKQIVNGFEVDFYWPDLKLVVETDGLRYHRTPAAQARDALRDQTHTAAGYARLRFTHHQIKYEPRHVLDILTRIRRRLEP
jgi:very-short-patch-repair endonuclease